MVSGHDARAGHHGAPALGPVGLQRKRSTPRKATPARVEKGTPQAMKRPEIRRFRGVWRLSRDGVPFGPKFTEKHRAVRHALDLAELERVAVAQRRRADLGPALAATIQQIRGRKAPK